MNESSTLKADDATLLTANELDATQVTEIGGAGAENCTVTVEVGTSGVSVTYSGNSVGEALIAAYEGMVDATSHVIGRVLGP